MPESREKLKEFLDSDDPAAVLAELEGVPFEDDCGAMCGNEYAVIITTGHVNHYLCPECFNQLKKLIEEGPLCLVTPTRST